MHNEKENNDKKILIIGVFHGDEPLGEVFINSYLEKSQKVGKNSLYFIPKLNPSGKRKNINNVDLNRNFPTKNWKPIQKESDYFGGTSPASENETKFLINLIDKNKFSAIITIHAPYKTVNYDGPAQDLAQKISEIIGYPTSNDIGYPTPGSFGTYCGVERNIPTITLEIDENENMELLNNKFHILFDYLKFEY